MILQICNRSSQSPSHLATYASCPNYSGISCKIKMTVNSYIYVKFCRPTEENKILIGFSSGFCSPAAFPVARVSSVSQASTFPKSSASRSFPRSQCHSLNNPTLDAKEEARQTCSCSGEAILTHQRTPGSLSNS